jgi:hypothetical protein
MPDGEKIIGMTSWLHPERGRRLLRLKMLRDGILVVLLLCVIVFPAGYPLWIPLLILCWLAFGQMEKKGLY